MRLKNITISGFKSFPDKTTLSLDGQVTAIVGPNGCGKSNVVDALRWVIGETSAKQLRGSSMSDVVFNGTSSRAPLAKASVELLLDNTSKKLLGEYAAFNEISIRREVGRDGYSQYKINGVGARRRDVIDLFLGTGLGPRSYSVIEQGMISQIIEAKPEEMRAYIEEVAGISKYKERRRETLNRTRHTNENMERVNDMCESVEKQLRHLQRQAKAAERYQTLKRDEQQLQADFRGIRLRDQYHDVRQSEVVLNEKQTLIDKHKATEQHLSLEMEKAHLQELESSDLYQASQKQFYAFDANIARMEQQISSIEENRKRWQLDLEQVLSSQEQVDAQLEEQDILLTQVNEFLTSHAPALVSLKEVFLSSEKRHKGQKDTVQVIQAKWDDVQLSCAEHEKNIQISRTKLEHYATEKSNIEEQENRLNQELEQLNPAEFDQQLVNLSQQVDRLKTDLNSKKNQREICQKNIIGQREVNQAIKHALPNLRRNLAEAQAQHKALEALKQAALDHYGEQTQRWLQENDLTQAPCLLEEIQVEKGWEIAFEMVVGHSFDALCVDDLSKWQEANTTFPPGLMLMSKPSSPASPSGFSADTLASKVKAPWSDLLVLQHIWVANDIATAKALLADIPSNGSVITIDGLWISHTWLRQAKVLKQEESLVARQARIDDLAKDIQAQVVIVEDKESELEQGESALVELQQNMDILREQEKHLSSQHARLSAEVLAVEKQRGQAQQRVDQSRHQLDSLGEKKQSCLHNQHAAQTMLDENQNILASLQDKKIEQKNLLEEAELELQETQDQLNQSYREHEKHSLSLSSKQQEQHVLKQSFEQLSKQAEQLKQRSAHLNNQLNNEEQNALESLQNQLQALLVKRSEADQNMQAAQENWNSKQVHHQSLAQQIKEMNQTIQSVAQKIESLKIQIESSRVRQQTLEEQLVEMNKDPKVIIEQLPDDLTIELCEKEITQVQNKIQRLGPINLAAIEECKVLSQRKSYLDSQYADLSEALALLDDAIRTIDRETKAKFKATFTALNAHFKDLFPKVFGGGQAELFLTDDDVLVAGVGITAQPPGKRNSRIQMLSGGEKAMTAVALVFALFKLNPAPICILDEVDAPLDDSNVSRFCSLLKQISHTVQLIVISHNKVTIESAERLMGVTMSEPGVSRLVSVDVKQAVAMAE